MKVLKAKKMEGYQKKNNTQVYFLPCLGRFQAPNCGNINMQQVVGSILEKPLGIKCSVDKALNKIKYISNEFITLLVFRRTAFSQSLSNKYNSSIFPVGQ